MYDTIVLRFGNDLKYDNSVSPAIILGPALPTAPPPPLEAQVHFI